MNISSSYSQLKEAFTQNASVVIDGDRWHTRSFLMTFIRKCLGLHAGDILLASTKIAAYIKEFPVRSQDSHNGLGFTKSDEIDSLLLSVQNSLKLLYSKKIEQHTDVKNKKKNGKKAGSENTKIKQQLTHFRKKENQLFTTLSELSRAQLSVRSLMKSQKDIEQEQPKEEDILWLKKRADSFEKRQKIPLTHPQSQEQLQNKINRACKYPEFIEALRHNYILKESFLKILCRDSSRDSIDAIDCAIQTPYIQDLLKKSYLDKRLQRIANNGLKFIELENKKKDVQLRIYGRYQSISALSKSVEIANAVSITVEELFNRFSAINDRLIDIEYVETGVEQIDFYLNNPNSFEKENWWDELPLIEKVSKEELQSRFVDGSFEDTAQIHVAIRATRQSSDLNIANTHSFLDIYIPIKGEPGKYNLISPGKYAEEFLPSFAGTSSFSSLKAIAETVQKAIKSILMIFATKRGVYFLVDQNKYMSHRYHEEMLLPNLNQGQITLLMDFIKKMFLESKEKKMIFQAQGDNCTTPIAELLKTLYPDSKVDPFTISLTEVLLPLPLKWIQKTEKICLKRAHWNRFRIWISSWFRADKKGHNNTALIDSSLWREGYIHLPAMLFHKKKEFLNSISKKKEEVVVTIGVTQEI